MKNLGRGLLFYYHDGGGFHHYLDPVAWLEVEVPLTDTSVMRLVITAGASISTFRTAATCPVFTSFTFPSTMFRALVFMGNACEGCKKK